MMPHPNTPWIGVVALAAMFALPFLPGWLFDGPRTVKHHPRRHVCAECGAPWAAGHACAADPAPGGEVLHGELRRADTSTTPLRRSIRPSETDI